MTNSNKSPELESLTITSGSSDVTNTITITGSTIDLGYYQTHDQYAAAQSTLIFDDMSILSPSAINSITLGNLDVNTFNWNFTAIPFKDGFPDWDDFQSMCKEYPGLQITFEKMKEFYNLCKSDWEDKKKGEK